MLKNAPQMQMRDEKRHCGFGPALILDVDNKGVDFTFKGMGLKGNRPKPETEEEEKPKTLTEPPATIESS